MMKLCLIDSPCICARCKHGDKLMKNGGLPCCVTHGTSCPAIECAGFEEKEEKHDNRHRSRKH